MRFLIPHAGFLAAILVAAVGCKTASHRVASQPASKPKLAALEKSEPSGDEPKVSPASHLAQAKTDAPPAQQLAFPNISPEPLPPVEGVPVLLLIDVVDSVRGNFPLIEQAAASRVIASGEALGAMGAFDHKVDAFSEAQPLDFYENYRSQVGVKRDTMWGGQTFAGYRIGRGEFEPWYLERETNRGGEFKAGFMAPVVRDRWIDANRAALWHAQLERRRVEPEILAQVLLYTREGSVAYWQWVAAGANLRIADQLLELAEQRNEGIQAQVAAKEKAPLELVDNRRIIVSREAKRVDALRKVQQTAIKLSLFFRAPDGTPLLADDQALPAEFPLPGEEFTDLEGDTQVALAQRPELAELRLIRRQYEVALQQALNETWCDVDAGLLVAQDVGSPTSSKRDKSEFEVEALVTMSVPLERRKALGKARALRGKLAAVAAKSRFASDKIVADVQMSHAALRAARTRVQQASESYRLAVQVQNAEQELFDLGQSTLFNLNIREKQTAEAAAERVVALLEYHTARADYAFALGLDGVAPE